MSDIAKLNLTLAGVVTVLVMIVVLNWPTAPIESAYSALASPYCTTTPSPVPILGGAAFVKDLVTGSTLYAKNETAQLPLASLTKLMTVLVASDTLDRDGVITIPADALAPEGGVIFAHESWRTEDLMDFTLITSDNDGAHALGLLASEKAGEPIDLFVERMNARARGIGMSQTYYTSDTGLDISESTGSAYGSAYDMALLLEYIVREHPRVIEGTTAHKKTFTTLDGRAYEAQNTSRVIGSLTGAIGSKTGFTDLAGGNLGIVFEPILGRPVVAVVLGSTREGRDEDMTALISYAKRWLTRTIVCRNYLKNNP